MWLQITQKDYEFMHFSWQRIIPSIFFSVFFFFFHLLITTKLEARFIITVILLHHVCSPKVLLNFTPSNLLYFAVWCCCPSFFFLSELGNQSGWLLDVDQQFLRPQSFVSLCRHNWSKRQEKDVLNITLDKISKCFTVFFFAPQP